jgi:aspartate/methionine/tyrosine aminotransferase
VLYLVQIASKALYEYSNQYPSLLGIPELRQAVARHSAAQQDIPCEWTTDTLVTVGATEGIAAAFMGMVNPGDEVRQCENLVWCGVLWGGALCGIAWSTQGMM